MIARAVGQRLSALDPAHGAGYTKRAEALAGELTKLATAQRARFEKLPAAKRRVVTYHQSTIYWTDWLGLTEEAQVEPKPGIAHNPQHVARVLGLMRSQSVGVIAQEQFYPRRASDKLAQLARARVVVIAGGPAAGQSYVARLRALADTVYEAVSAKGSP